MSIDAGGPDGVEPSIPTFEGPPTAGLLMVHFEGREGTTFNIK